MRRLAGLLLAAALLVGCTAEPGLRLQAAVADDVDVVAAPGLAVPAFASTFVGVAEAAVREGDRVTAGQPVVLLDDRLLRARLTIAEADAEVARAQAQALAARQREADDAARELADKRVDVTDAIAELKQKRSEVKQAIKQLTSTRAKLTKQRAALRKQRDQLIGQRKQLQQKLAALPPGAPTPPELEAALATLNQGIGQLDAGLKKLDAGLAKLAKGLKQAKTGLAKLNTGLAKATDGLAKLDDAAADLRDARAQLSRLQRLADVAVDTAAVGVDLAKTQLDQAAVAAPRDGVVVTVAAAGDRLAPGATLATIRPDVPSRLVSWLSPAQAAAVCVGDAASVQTDWGQTAAAEVTRIAPAADFPPTSQATDETHLTRAFAIELGASAELPAGAPVTVSLQPCHPEGEPHGNS